MKKLFIFLSLLLLSVSHSAAGGQLVVSWTDNSTNEVGFKLERKTGESTFAQVAVAAANTTAYTDLNLANGTRYTYRLRAYNAVGNSAYSNEASKITPALFQTLTVLKNGTGTGTVTSSPPINCGSDCTETYTSPTLFTLTATPAVGSIFGGWSGGCIGTGICRVTANTDTSVTATFTIIPSRRDFYEN